MCCWTLERVPPYTHHFIDIIQHLIHPRFVGVPQSCQSYECLEEVVRHIELVEEQGIIDECLELPIDIIIQP